MKRRFDTPADVSWQRNQRQQPAFAQPNLNPQQMANNGYLYAQQIQHIANEKRDIEARLKAEIQKNRTLNNRIRKISDLHYRHKLINEQLARELSQTKRMLHECTMRLSAGDIRSIERSVGKRQVGLRRLHNRQM